MMKRSTSSRPVTRRHVKSPRLSDICVLQPQRQLQDWKEWNADSLDQKHFSRAILLCEKYSNFLPFGQDHARRDPSSAVASSGVAFQRGINEVEQILEDARLKVQMKCDDLEARLDDFIVACARNPSDSYEDGNMLDLELSQLKDFLYQLQPQNKEKFIEYVSNTIRQSVLRDATVEEYMGFNRRSIKEQKHIFLEKALALIQKLMELGRPDVVLPALVVLKSQYRLDNKRLTGLHLENGHHRIDSLIKSIVTRDFVEEPDCNYWISPNKTADLVDDEDRESDTMNYECSSELDGSRWTADPRGPKNDYWNFALCAQMLREAYLKSNTDKIDSCSKYLFGNGKCFHQSSIGLLAWLQRKAWSEVRASVMLTAGAVMPAELTEPIFRDALEAEGIPADPRVEETIMVDPPDWLDEEDRKQLSMTRPRPFKRTKQEYCCSLIKPADPEDVFLTRRDRAVGPSAFKQRLQRAIRRSG